MKLDILLPPLRRVARGDESTGLTVVEALAQLDAAARDPSLGADPHFLHYLQKRSYVKALDFLETGERAGHG